MPQEPIFFHISPDQCGARRIARLFGLNGYQYVYDEQGKLAENIAWSQTTGQMPLRDWSSKRLFTGLYRLKPWWKPPLESWRSFACLRQYFPNARFILTLREPDAWLLDRMVAESGATAKAYAAHYGVSEAELPELWTRDWQAHLDAVETYFGDDPALIRVDTETDTLEDLRHRLDPILPMPKSPRHSGWFFNKEPEIERTLLRMFDPAPETPRQRAEEFVEDVARFCLKGHCNPGTGNLAGLSPLYCEWDGRTQILDRAGHACPVAITDLPGDRGKIALADPALDFKQRRAEAVINDILGLGRCDAANIDMEDARWLGATPGAPLGKPVLCHNRREGAGNAILWPLPEMMGPGHRGYVSPCPDRTPFEDKQDKLVWRGMISGNERSDGIRPGRSSLRYMREMAAAGNDARAREIAWQGLCRTNRMAVVRRWFGHPHCDIRIGLAWSFRHFAKDPLLSPFCTRREGPGFFHDFRYQLCMTGFDHGSNFIPMINSRSVLLKEEDGWEVYFSGRFKPWKHYIPLQRYCGDLGEKLEWARRNPNDCKEMSHAAREEVALLSDPALMRAIKHRILDGLARKG
ncbi:glycosyl transferase family 90 [Paracoccus onubensis]|uniref:glycosyl transferase family 90 n=1 Tax=Paracoccus onubensis TaxID=1675788 RepID=UPI00272FFB67|nr:glycosyl transferase family 90 [Paracoccus onubensis]MDP0929211.1 glycosyl transferase family 90 [Paracoccus onubensis]